MIVEKPSLYRMERQRDYNATGEPTNEDREARSFDAGEDEGSLDYVHNLDETLANPEMMKIKLILKTWKNI